ncbi:unnamed protein product [Arctia plantaginis]|uniref:Uncharacterized protein n=1 Tax=Arctia plantaginis TaxID=874455 RepID=A0A8S0Z1N6_ARCPL|nr:unnamed protein product [Arctia plantaginis]
MISARRKQRYIGLPGMLKAGEYSPNNPLLRGERAPGDALLGLGEYERHRNTLRKIRQQQYREYLDQQAKKKQEEKEQAERERREREQREREREERERELVQERDRYSPDRRRSLQQIQSSLNVQSLHRDQYVQLQPLTTGSTTCGINKVDTGVQVDGFSQPLSVAVQTDDADMYRCGGAGPLACSLSQLTQAERELSPRTVPTNARRRSYGDFDERNCLLKKCNRDKWSSELRHTYMPSIFDAETIRLRNIQSEKEAAERRQYYQQELKNQIMEQQRIREERKNREKMLEQAEMRRLEEQLRMLRLAQEREHDSQRLLDAQMKHNTTEYNIKRSELQREIDMEHDKLYRAKSQPNKNIPKRNTDTSKSETVPSKLPFYYPQVYERTNEIQKKPYSFNIPDNSLFSSNYDVDSYLRKNLNFNKEKDFLVYEKDDFKNTETDIERDDLEIKRRPPEKQFLDNDYVPIENKTPELVQVPVAKKVNKEKNVVIEKALVHEISNVKTSRPTELIEKQPSKKAIETIDTLPIPVLRHSPKTQSSSVENVQLSEAMKRVEDKWKVPAVQKNILKALPNEEGKNVNILTQLGSIRRQLQLEQLKLDKLSSKDDV